MLPAVGFKGFAHQTKRTWFRVLCSFLLLTYGSEILGMDLLRMREACAQSITFAPAMGVVLPQSSAVPFSSFKAISIDPADPLKLNFLVSAGDGPKVDANESRWLVKYFLTFLAMPDEDIWVNLSPSEPDRIINPALARTAVGKDMLTQDYLLKQLAASITFPDSVPGKKFWEQVYSRIRKEYGDIDLPVNTFSKVWVVPEKAVVYEQKGAAVIAQSKLTVMLDEDYLTMKKRMIAGASVTGGDDQVNQVYLRIAREIIIPELEREVNEGAYFVKLRQMFDAMILAVWFKKELRGNVINRTYSNQKKTSGIQIEDKQISRKVYSQYMLALKKGVYDVIREDFDSQHNEVIPRRYFSGGFSFKDAAQRIEFLPMPSDHAQMESLLGGLGKKLFRFVVSLTPRGISRKTFLTLVLAAGLFIAPMTVPAAKAHTQDVSTTSNALHQVSLPTLSRGDVIPTQDQKYFSFMKKYLNVNDFKDIQGRKNPATGKKYHFDWHNIQRHWPEIVSDPVVVGWHQEAAIVVAQYKLGVKEDGKMGPKTRQAFNRLMAQGRQEQPSLKEVLQKDPHPIIQEKEKIHQEVLELARSIRAQADTEPSEAFADTRNITLPPSNQPLAATPVQQPEPSIVAPKVHPTISPLSISTSVENPTMGSSPASAPDAYVLSAHSAIVPDDVALIAQTNGIVAGLDPHKMQYEAGETIFRLTDPALTQQLSVLNQALMIEKNKLTELLQLQARQAATSQEIDPVHVRINDLMQQWVRLTQSRQDQVVVAPVRLTIKNMLAANGKQVNKGDPLMDYLTWSKAWVTVDMPLNETYFGRIRDFKIDGHPVDGILKVDWQFSPDRTRAQVRFLVRPSQEFPDTGISQIDAQILPPENMHTVENAGIKGQAQTLGVVRQWQEQSVLAPETGSVQFFVKEGDRVKAGQVLAVQDGSSVQEHESLLASYKSVMAQLRRASAVNGTRFVPRGQIAALEEKAALLKSMMVKLKTQATRQKIVSPESGIITDISNLQASSFREGDLILRIRTDIVMVGDALDMNAAILLPDNVKINVNDPVLIQAPNATYLPAKVTRINKMPESSLVKLHGVWAIELMASDPQGVLGKNLPVKVIVPTAAEKPSLEKWLTASADEKNASATIQNSGKRLAAKNIPGVKDALLHSPRRISKTMFVTLPPVMPVAPADIAASREGKPMTLQEADSGVFDNELMNGDLKLDYLKSRAAEELANPSSFSLTGGVYLIDGKVTFSGGLGTMLQGVAGSLATGNAISAALPAVFNLSSQIIDLISGKNEQSRELAGVMTRIAWHHLQEMMSQQGFKSQSLLIDIRQAQNQIGQLTNLSAQMENAKEVMNSRLSRGYAVTTDMEALTQQIAEVNSKLAGWQTKERQWTIELNNMLKANLEEKISPMISWDGTFRSISNDEQKAMNDQLSSVQSPNYRLKAARTALLATEKTIALQRLSLLPSLDLHSLYMTSGDNYNPMYDQVPGAYLRTSSLQEGANAAIKFTLPVFDTATDAKNDIASIEMKKAQLNLSRIYGELDSDLTRVVTDIRALSSQITQETLTYNQARQTWQSMASRTDLFRADQLVPEHLQMVRAMERLDELKGKYFKAEAQLKQMQVLGYQETLVSTAPRVSSLTRRVTEAVAEAVAPGQDESYFNSIAAPVINTVEDDVINVPVTVAFPYDKSVGDVTYAPMFQIAQMWSLMNVFSGASNHDSNALIKILTEDPNIINRMQSVDQFLEQRQHDSRFPDIAERLILDSPYPDVIEKMLLSMVDQGGQGARFLLRIIDQAIQHKNTLLTQQALQRLNDVLSDPVVFKGFSEFDFDSVSATGEDISADVARRVLLTFLNWAPQDSMARTRLLQSGYWSSGQLAKIYN
ncbi:MAG: TolC family protein, partial [Candidatus Omnitrophota bacterium]